MTEKINNRELGTAAISSLAVAGLGLAVRSYMRLRSDNKTLQEKLAAAEHRANTDHLTGLPNRSVLERDYAGLQHSRNSRSGDGGEKTKHSLLVIDLDHFKTLNDTQGHAAGDSILIAVADTMRASTRGRDVPVRQGGDEFVVLLPRADVDEAAEVAERIRRGIDELPGFITASIGVTEIDLSQPLDANLLLADRAAYNAKENGRNQVAISGQPESI